MQRCSNGKSLSGGLGPKGPQEGKKNTMKHSEAAAQSLLPRGQVAVGPKTGIVPNEVSLWGRKEHWGSSSPSRGCKRRPTIKEEKLLLPPSSV